MCQQIRSLVEEGALGKASNLLLSRGLHDPNDQGVLRTLAGLLPVGMPTAPPAWTSRAPDTDPDSRSDRLLGLENLLSNFATASPGPKIVFLGPKMPFSAVLHHPLSKCNSSILPVFDHFLVPVVWTFEPFGEQKTGFQVLKSRFWAETDFGGFISSSRIEPQFVDF